MNILLLLAASAHAHGTDLSVHDWAPMLLLAIPFIKAWLSSWWGDK